MDIISITSDLGVNSPSIGIAKARLWSVLPTRRIVDLSHSVEPSDINESHFLLKMLIGHCAPGTLHIVAVDFTDRKSHPEILFAEGFGQYFIGYNTGLFPMLLSEEQSFFKLGEYSDDHSNMIPSIAPVIKDLSDEAFRKSLQPIPKEDLVVKRALKPVLTDGKLTGTVIYVDDHGTLFTNIRMDDLKEIKGHTSIQIILSRHESIDTLSKHPGEVQPGEVAGYYCDAGTLAISVNQGNASKLLGIKKGNHIIVEPSNQDLFV